MKIKGIYDSGSNVSLINSKITKLKSKEKNYSNTELQTINGVKKTKGMIAIKIKIFGMEKEMYVHVIDKENFDYDFLIGLDIIEQFKLIQNEDLKITQAIPNLQKKEKALGKEEDNIAVNLLNFNEHINEIDCEIKIDDYLNSQQRDELEVLIDNYRSIFAKDKYDVGTVKGYEAHIDLLVDKYCSKRPYKCSIKDKKEIEEQISKLLQKNLIEDSYSPFAAPVTLAFKRDDNKKSRLCIDFRDLNKIVVPQAQPFPLIDDLIIQTRDCSMFSTLDINSAFWAIPVRINDRKKTGFITQSGHYQWTCLPFGLKTSPAIFQRIISNILRKHNLTEFAVSFIDDILIFSKNFAEHIKHLTLVLEALSKEGFRLKFTKCKFASKSVKYLGHIITNNTVSPLNDNLISIKNFPTPKTKQNIRQFLGKINFYHKYIPNRTTILDPIYKLLRKNQEFIWSEECKKSFDKVKKLLCSKPILEIFDHKRPIKIYTDASLQGIGAVLKQTQDNGEEKPVAYFSKKLNELQKRKKAIYLECLAIKEAIKYWHFWLIGKSFKVYCDHKPLENLNIKSRTDEELGELTYFLSQYDFQIIYNPGENNLEADALSRNPVLESDTNNENKLQVVNLIDLKDIMLDQDKNEEIHKNRGKLITKQNVHYKKINKKEKIILSEPFSIELIKKLHTKMCHLGINQMIRKISPFYTAKNLTKNIKQTCKNCTICIKNKSRGQAKYGFMSQLGPAKKPFEIISIDTIGGFGGARSTKKYLHLLVDHFTRYAYITTSKTQDATNFIKLVKSTSEVDKINTILADQYPGINSKEFKKNF